MNTEEILQKVKELVLKEYDYRFKSIDELTPETPLIYDFDGDSSMEGEPPVYKENIDSTGKRSYRCNLIDVFPMSALCRISLTIEVEDFFNIEITDEEADELTTIQHFVEFIDNKFKLGLFGKSKFVQNLRGP